MSWVTPFIGRTDMHCWDLVREVYAQQCRIALPVYGEVDYTELDAIAKAVEAGTQAKEPWERIARFPGDEKPFDVAVMRDWLRCDDGKMRRGVIHTGIITRRGYVLHTSGRSAVVEVQLSHPTVRRRLIACYRHIACR
jgi:hypothetical protein